MAKTLVTDYGFLKLYDEESTDANGDIIWKLSLEGGGVYRMTPRVNKEISTQDIHTLFFSVEKLMKNLQKLMRETKMLKDGLIIYNPPTV